MNPPSRIVEEPEEEDIVTQTTNVGDDEITDFEEKKQAVAEVIDKKPDQEAPVKEETDAKNDDATSESDSDDSDFGDMLSLIQKDMMRRQMNKRMLKTFDLFNFDDSDDEGKSKKKEKDPFESSEDEDEENETAPEPTPAEEEKPEEDEKKSKGAKISAGLLSKVKSSAVEMVKPEAVQVDKKMKEEKKKEPKPKKSFKERFCSCNPKQKIDDLKNSRYASATFYKNNPSYIGAFILYILLSIGFVLLQLLVLHVNIPWYVAVARGCAILIYFNTNLIFLTVLRRVTTWFRNTKIGRGLSVIDEFIEFHKFMGVWNFILSWLHSFGQFINLYYASSAHSGNFVEEFNNETNMTEIVDKSAGSYAETLLWTASGVGWIGGGAAPTGWVLLIAYCIMIFFASSTVRRKGFFQAFYITHKLYYVYIIAFFFHAPHFWKWFLPIAILLVIERLVNKYRTMKKSFGETYIKDVNLLSSKVTHLAITRPPGFKFQSGDYMFIKIPEIAKHEWHPFTISSATELKDEIWVHVRSLGNWTNRLNDHFTNKALEQEEKIRKDYEQAAEAARKAGKKPKKPPSKVSQKLSSMVVVTDYGDGSAPIETPLESGDKSNVNLVSNKLTSIYVPILLDGPFGTASGRIFESEHAVLVAGGIGVTPFASILQSLWFQYAASLRSCPKCKHQWYSKYERKKLQKVDFVWVNRDFEAFEWFVELLAELEIQQSQLSKKERFLTIHLYMTSSKVEQYIKCWIDPNSVKDMKKKKLLNELLKEQNKNFKLKLIPGRPPFNDMFQTIQGENKGKVDVYFCGAPRMGQELMKAAKEFNFNFSQENF